ncbi:MAG: ribosomal RNA small subunit methyltransferase A, partial [Patescibacteria group bacterium]
LDVDEKRFFNLVKIGFSARRKTLLNNLSSGWGMTKEKTEAILKAAGIDSRKRAQELSLLDWEKIYLSFNTINRIIGS